MATLVRDRYAGSTTAAGGDAALLSGLRAGDRDAFQQLYELYRAQIYNLTLRIVHSPEDACDITQEVFIKAFRKLPDSPVTDEHLTPWLYRVAVNASYDHLRTRKVHRDIDDLGADSRAVRVDGFEQAEMGRRVEQTLAALSERHRTVLVLKDIHGLRHDEIAEILGTSRNAAETLLFRARDAFRVKYLELTHGQPGSRNVEKWGAAGITLGAFLHELPLPAALQGGFPFGAAGAGGAGAAATGTGAAGTGAAGTTGGAAAGTAAGGAGGASTGMSLAAGGLLAKVGGVAGAKIAAVVIAATVATGGGAAAAYETGALPGLHTGAVERGEHGADSRRRRRVVARRRPGHLRRAGELGAGAGRGRQRRRARPGRRQEGRARRAEGRKGRREGRREGGQGRRESRREGREGRGEGGQERRLEQLERRRQLELERRRQLELERRRQLELGERAAATRTAAVTRTAAAPATATGAAPTSPTSRTSRTRAADRPLLLSPSGPAELDARPGTRPAPRPLRALCSDSEAAPVS